MIAWHFIFWWNCRHIDTSERSSLCTSCPKCDMNHHYKPPLHSVLWSTYTQKLDNSWTIDYYILDYLNRPRFTSSNPMREQTKGWDTAGIYGAPWPHFGEGLHDADDSPFVEEKLTLFPVLKRFGDEELQRAEKLGTSTSNSFCRTNVAGAEIGDVTSSESEGEYICWPRIGASGTSESESTMTFVLLSDIVITSWENSTLTSYNPKKLARRLNSGSSRWKYAAADASIWHADVRNEDIVRDSTTAHVLMIGKKYVVNQPWI